MPKGANPEQNLRPTLWVPKRLMLGQRVSLRCGESRREPLREARMSEEVTNNARQHGGAVAEYVAAKIKAGRMTPARAVEILNIYMAKQIETMRMSGIGPDVIAAWIRAVEAAFDDRLAELADPD